MSEQAVRALEQFAQKNAGRMESLAFLSQAIRTTHEALIEGKRKGLLPAHAGTTIVAALVVGNRAWIAWAGDSRAYWWQKSGRMELLTQDHSLVQRLVQKGELTPDAAQTHPLRHVITRALGNESFELEESTREISLAPGDVLLLCSDGVSDVLKQEELQEVISQHDTADVRRMADRLLEKVNQIGRSRSEEGKLWKLDNASVIVARWEEAK